MYDAYVALLPGNRRTLMLAYALVITMACSLDNFRNNMHVASESVSCGKNAAMNASQTLLKNALSPITCE